MVSTDGRSEPNSEVRGHRHQKVLARGHSRGVRHGRIVFPCCQYWQSYHLFFLAPDGDEFHFEDETEGMEQPEDPEEQDWTDHLPGRRLDWLCRGNLPGCAVCRVPSLATSEEIFPEKPLRVRHAFFFSWGVIGTVKLTRTAPIPDPVNLLGKSKIPFFPQTL
jgi:hypothetical protein